MGRYWSDKIVQYPRRFNLQNNADGTVTLIPAPGVITQEGTPVNAAMLNSIEVDLAQNASDIVTHSNDNAHEGGKIYAYKNIGGAL